ncbi:hypothetical protein DdX_02574 [Ditylenchus destructor]|uniref:Uncharacterized protein n=1 Tax=Ditylenchus destructor TaxID=166010 RepID=A0AAD4NCV3_9BILA|nr:hypothetical protein DdX_02574 [Ditylenchus destructor]
MQLVRFSSIFVSEPYRGQVVFASLSSKFCHQSRMGFHRTTQRLRRMAAPLFIQDFPESINPGTRKCSQRDRYQSTQLVERKRLTYHTPGSEPRRVICDLAKSRIFRISGSHKSRNSQILSARPVPIDSSRREEAIDVSHARIRAPTEQLAPGQIQDFPDFRKP